MKRRTFLILSALGLQPRSFKAAVNSLTRSPGPTIKSADLRLWYRQPASEWNEALPIGNGRLADIAPTLLALMGMAQPQAMTGHNLLVAAGAGSDGVRSDSGGKGTDHARRVSA